MKKIVMALAVVMFAGLFWPSKAEARCWWNGYRTHCTHYRHHYRYGHYYPYRYYRPYYYGSYRPYYYRAWACVWPFCIG